MDEAEHRERGEETSGHVDKLAILRDKEMERGIKGSFKISSLKRVILSTKYERLEREVSKEVNFSPPDAEIRGPKRYIYRPA